MGYLSSPSSPTSSTKNAYSPKAAFNKIKNSFRSSPPMISPSRIDSPAIPARISSTPDKISKFWAAYNYWHPPPPPPPPIKKSPHARIQITRDKEVWYSLNISHIRDPVAIKDQILKRMHLDGDCDQYYYFHENGSDPGIDSSQITITT